MELHWWLTNYKVPSVVHHAPPTHFLITDASDMCWGAVLDGQCLQGTWSTSEQNLHCNHKEFIAIRNVLEEHYPCLTSTTLHIQCDNKTVVSYLRNEGGTKSQALLALAIDVFKILDRHNIQMCIYHLPGMYNTDADCLSRGKMPAEWHLQPSITRTVFSKWGTPQIDLFASHRAHVVQNYCTLDRTDPHAIAYNALSLDWTYSLAWMFPPPYLIPRVLAQLNKARGTYLVVVPRWEKVFWRPDLKSRATGPPFTIRNLVKGLVDVSTGLPPPKVTEMILEVWRCGGGSRV